MNILVSEHAGFCFGVKKAINAAYKEVDKSKEKKMKIYTYGPLIHNKQVIEKMESIGIQPTTQLETAKDNILIIRSHGVPFDVYAKAKELNIQLIDATCPFVRKVQKTAREYYLKGYNVIIVGDPKHPEVIGINGWCDNKAVIVKDLNGLDDQLNGNICVVAQTTITLELWESIVGELNNKYENVLTFNTICSATHDRQRSCSEIAKKVDIMIVIGGHHSSNTQKLYQISKEFCHNSFHIETVEELPIDIIKNSKNIGVTAGASTPDWIIKEVINRMNNIDQNSMENMMDEIENSLRIPRRGNTVTGKVLHVTDNEIIVNIGYKSDGVVPKEEISNNPSVNPKDIVKEGDEIEVFVMKTDDGEGNLLLSKKKVDAEKAWEQMDDVLENSETISVNIVETVKGGVIATYDELKGFIPASHLSDGYVNNLQDFVGKTLTVKVIDFNRQKKKLVFSHKVVIEEENLEKKRELWEKIEKDMIIEGEVKRLANFGAFVDIGGVDGLIHISDLSWGRVSNPGSVLSVGDKVQVMVLDFDKEKERISLGLKQMVNEPWSEINDKYTVGSIVKGKVVRLVDFGAFVELEAGVDGLVHISQISKKHIAKPSEALEVNQMVEVKILDIDAEAKRISLSIKEAVAEQEQDTSESVENYEVTDEGTSIGEIIQSKEEKE